MAVQLMLIENTRNATSDSSSCIHATIAVFHHPLQTVNWASSGCSGPSGGRSRCKFSTQFGTPGALGQKIFPEKVAGRPHTAPYFATPCT